MATVYVRFPAPRRVPAAPSPLLERLLARADSQAHIGDWRRDAFALIAQMPDPPPAVAPAALLAALGPQDGRTAFLATPVHCTADMTSVHLDADGILPLDGAEAAELARDFNRVLGGAEFRLLASPTGKLFCITDRVIAAAAADPQNALARDIGGFLPTGSGAPALRALMSEIEMWLFDHPLNRARSAAGRAPVTGLWLWGGGALLTALPPLSGWVAGADALFDAHPARAPVSSCSRRSRARRPGPRRSRGRFYRRSAPSMPVGSPDSSCRPANAAFASAVGGSGVYGGEPGLGGSTLHDCDDTDSAPAD